MLGRMGIATGVDLDAAIATARWIEQQVGRTVPGMLVKAGPISRGRRACCARGAMIIQEVKAT